MISGTYKEKEARLAVFLDRDGTIIKLVNYIKDPKDVELIEGAAEAIKELNRTDLLVLMVTNQAGVAKGYFTIQDVDSINAKMEQLIQEGGGYLDDIYICPHHPSEGETNFTCDCDCRKPKPGLLQEAAQEYGLSLDRCWIVGDNKSDIAAGKAAGVKTILVRTGHGADMEKEMADDDAPDHVVDDLPQAVKIILGK